MQNSSLINCKTIEGSAALYLINGNNDDHNFILDAV